ncbi:unnamed protein product [Euphydryas editha]|uniref:Transposase n=1 Tax=Euphydryas editha TaxID=104508 RepID=A0AAU9V0X6_EUPED|nr:unnamed protein product [Euphydryas editha]
MDTTPEAASQVVALIEAGQNQSQVACQLNLSRYAVRRVYQRYQQTGCVSMVTTDGVKSIEDLVSVLLSAASPNGSHTAVIRVCSGKKMSLAAKTELVFVTGTNTDRRSGGLTIRRYVEEILEEHVVLFSGVIDENFVKCRITQDHTPPL